MPVIDSSPSDVTSAEDDDVVLQCGGKLEGDPSPSITWRKLLTDDLPSNAEVSESGELMLVKATESDAGTYECTATNFVGTATGEVTLTIRRKNVIVAAAIFRFMTSLFSSSDRLHRSAIR